MTPFTAATSVNLVIAAVIIIAASIGFNVEAIFNALGALGR